LMDSTLASLLELNAEERGFALTHDSTHLQSSRHLKDVIESNLRQIKTVTADNPRQQATYARLADLIRARVALIEELKTQPFADENLETPRNKLAGQIRTVLLEMRLEEERLLGQRLQEAAAGNRQMKAFLDVVYSCSLLLFGLTVYAIFLEIEKRKESEESLRRAQEQYRLLFDSNPIPVWVYDLETLDILDVNATASNRYGYTREEFLRLKISDLRPQSDVPKLLKNIREATQSVQDAGPWRHERKSGEIIDVQIRSYPLNFGGKDARLVVATDITEQKKAEDALKESEERFRLIVSNIKDYAIIVLNPGGTNYELERRSATDQGI